MEWLNLNIAKFLRSPEFIGADPTDRSTSIMLLGLCAAMENGGVIRDCAGWKCRKWQQLAGVTLAEVRRTTELWAWHGNDLHVHFYPVEKEAEVRANRENGHKGGRPRKTTRFPIGETQTKPPGFQSVSESLNPDGNQTETRRSEIAETERKGMEGKGKEKEGEERADARRRAAEALVSACPFPDLTIPALTAAADCLRRHAGGHSFEDILARTTAATALYRQWPENERLAFRSSAERFFREDLWRRDPDGWRSRRAARSSIHSTGLDLDLGTRSAPPGGDLVFPPTNPTTNPTTATA